LRRESEDFVTAVFPDTFRLIDDTESTDEARPTPSEYAAWVKQQLKNLQPGDEAILRLRRPRPTAAFSPQDTTHPDYQHIKELARTSGFEPIERGTGGRLTMFDENALAITIIAPHAEPHAHTIKRYEIFSSTLAGALTDLGIDARVGELPHEYCPGRFSINAEGKVKLVGIAQRMNRRCIQMGAIIAVDWSGKACAAIADAYRAMDLPFDPSTYGAITELAPHVTYDEVRTVMIAALADMTKC
jgi:octanoyl-[GcvH]:protein N-octanoyltransferase